MQFPRKRRPACLSSPSSIKCGPNFRVSALQRHAELAAGQSNLAVGIPRWPFLECRLLRDMIVLDGVLDGNDTDLLACAEPCREWQLLSGTRTILFPMSQPK